MDIATTALLEKPTFATAPTTHFYLETPTSSFLVDASTVTLTEKSGPVSVFSSDHKERSLIPGDHKAGAGLVAGIVERAQRDAARYPNSARVRANLGLALLNNEDLDAAVEELLAALSIDPAHYLAKGGLARARMQQNRLADARALYQELHGMRPDDPNPVMALAQLAMQTEQWDEVIAWWSTATTLAPLSAAPHFGYGVALLALRRNREAIQQLRRAVRLDDRSAPLQQSLGVAYAMAGDYDRAVRSFKVALALAPHLPEAVLGLAVVLLGRERYDDVIELLASYLRARPDDSDANEALAWAYVSTGRFKEARAQLYQALQAMAKDGPGVAEHRGRLTNNLGVCYARLKDQDEASRLFKSSIDIQPTSTPVPYHNLARMYGGARRFTEAGTILAQCATQFPHDLDTRLLIAFCLEMREQYDQAIAELRRVIETAHAPVGAYTLLARLLTDAKHDPGAALAYLDIARLQAPDDPIVANDLAYAYLMHGNGSAARAVLDSMGSRVSGEAAIALAATCGLLHLWEGDIQAGMASYIEAERIARDQEKHSWIPMIQQKMYLELARARVRMEQRQEAYREVRKGLALEGNPLYRRDLDALARELKA